MPTLVLLFKLLLKLLLVLGGGLAIAYLAACVFLLFRQNRFIFFPAPVSETTPAVVNLVYQDIWIPITTPTGKAERLHGWWMPPTEPEQGVILYVHGNGANVGATVSQSQRFHQLGLSVFVFDYRGYGRSEGSFPTEAQVYADTQAAWNYLTQVREIPPEQIFLYGHSLGGAIAIDLAIKQPEVAGLIVESSFTSMRRMVDVRGGFGLFPADLLLTQKFNSLEKVRSLKTPVLFIHGTLDLTVPAEMSRTLFQAAPEPKQLLLVEDAGHNDVAAIGEGRYLQVIQQFVEQVQTRQKQTAVSQ
ncbi:MULTISPECIES: alpha/beta hydrolase [Trichocoleus]|uniref:Alpha/beta hydrolase n=1 Tax=Trichocoleus desertorum GB2-A4 TaxID=2933944 RepID=A0ABV0J5N0_9CYAN|nr:alpha/beta hydrolase [Trichocoleus sp. FACHB-46]MBD1863918.1 alpha/beta hydrolase [Trichocoleus sp. FACHB-46]